MILELKDKEPDFLEPARQKINGRTSYVCPNCGNGKGKDGTGIALNPKSTDRVRYKCFVCGLHEDCIGLWKIFKGITDNSEAVRTLCEYYGINPTGTEYKQHKNVNDNAGIHVPDSGNTAYLSICKKNINNTDYPAERGLNREVTEKFMLGYDPQFKTKDHNGNYVSWKALIIPTGKDSYVVRNTDAAAGKKDRYRKRGANRLYNTEALKNTEKPIFIVEGELDALAVMTAGGEALALGSTENYQLLIRLLEKEQPVQPLAIALDNDESGSRIASELAEGLDRLHIAYYRVNPYGDCKDAGEAILKDREGFISAVQGVKNIEDEILNKQKEEYRKSSAAYYLKDFVNRISADTKYFPTGFEKLDQALDGGLYEGLYIIGAISSLGKTSLIIQIADQIAESGDDVLVFSLEMSRSELMAKSISRHTLLDVLQNNGDIRNAKTTRGITAGSRYSGYSKAETELIQRAIAAYEKYACNIYIHEGIGDIGTEQIRDMVKQHILLKDRKPAVIVDYLQILAPADIRATDKQNTDKAVLELKRISRDFKLPIIAISAFNRANYSSAVSMEAFKESGAIEYSSDVLVGLQLKGVGTVDFDLTSAKQKNPREIELVVLKNRNGAVGSKVNYRYYPLFNYFDEE